MKEHRSRETDMKFKLASHAINEIQGYFKKVQEKRDEQIRQQNLLNSSKKSSKLDETEPIFKKTD